MHPGWWDILADGVKWLKANEGALRDVHWFGGDPVGEGGRGAIYGYASAGAGKGIVVVRNSADAKLDFSDRLSRILDLPETASGAKVTSKKVVYSHGAKIGDAKSCADTLSVSLEPHSMAVVEFALGR